MLAGRLNNLRGEAYRMRTSIRLRFEVNVTLMGVVVRRVIMPDMLELSVFLAPNVFVFGEQHGSREPSGKPACQQRDGRYCLPRNTPESGLYTLHSRYPSTVFPILQEAFPSGYFNS